MRVAFVPRRDGGLSSDFEYLALKHLLGPTELHRVESLSVVGRIPSPGVFEKTIESETLPSPLELHWKVSPLQHHRNAAIFSPPRLVDAGRLEPDIRRTMRALSHRAHSLFLADEQSDFEWEPPMGCATLYSPLFPEHHAVAISSSRWVFSSRPSHLAIAIANGIPAVGFFPTKPPPQWVTELGLPVMMSENPSSWTESAAEKAENFPWGRVTEKKAELFQKLEGHFRNLGLSFHRSEQKQPGVLHLCSISDSRYFPFLIGLMENVWRHHEGAVFHVLALDKKVAAMIAAHYPDQDVRCYQLGHLWSSSEVSQIEKRNLGFQAFSSKPRLIEKVLSQVRAPIIYCDSDVYFFQSPEDLAHEALDCSVLLFPHWNDTFEASRRDGLFNAGMVVASPGAEDFLRWWGNNTLACCEIDASRGLVADQGYLDFAPLYFPGVRSYLRGDHNVARWNAETLELKFSAEEPGRPLTGGGLPVRSFHAAFEEATGVFESKFAWDGLCSFFSDQDRPERLPTFFYTLVAQKKRYWNRLARTYVLWKQISKSEKDLDSSFFLFFVRGFGRHLLPIAAGLHRLFRGQGISKSSNTPPNWIQQQRNLRQSLIAKQQSSDGALAHEPK